MLRVTIDIVPFGIEASTRHIQTLDIARTTLHNNPEDYRCSVFAADGELVNLFWIRQHAYTAGAAVLVFRALSQLVS